MHRRSFVLAGLFAAAMLGSLTIVRAQDGAEPQPPQVVVGINSTAAPDLTDWLVGAVATIKQQHPKLSAMFATEGFAPPMQLALVADPSLPVPGATAGNVIHISPRWVRENPQDIGMVVHELVHVIQQYPRGGPGWVTEGIADYYRYYHFEPGSPRAAFELEGAHYKRGYQPTAAFLDYVVRVHDPQFVAALNAAMRKGEYKDDLFKDRTGKTADELWAMFVESKKKP